MICQLMPYHTTSLASFEILLLGFWQSESLKIETVPRYNVTPVWLIQYQWTTYDVLKWQLIMIFLFALRFCGKFSDSPIYLMYRISFLHSYSSTYFHFDRYRNFTVNQWKNLDMVYNNGLKLYRILNRFSTAGLIENFMLG